MRISHSNKPRVCITIGYPAGIGPEITIKALASPSIKRLANFLIIGNKLLFDKARRQCKKDIIYRNAKHESDIRFTGCNIVFFDIAQSRSSEFRPGIVSKDLGRESVKYIEKAVSLIAAHQADILVTAPIHKHAAYLSGFRHKGHTEFLACLAKVKKFAMMLKSDSLKVVLATTHVPVKDISKLLSKKSIADKLILMDFCLKNYFKLKKPKIAVCGLNPHAGDNGLIGDEEKSIIIPALSDVRARKINAIGPLAADSVFYDLQKRKYDAALCMYHDQGLTALKMTGRENAVNITLGLPFIRTSPGHGTALDIAGKNLAHPGSMKQSIKTAVEMYHMHAAIFQG
jgi:4-hydroxythreonine-4-phosphate dehydrogenase